ncbi:RNA methyltransferase [Candidatus Woesearchaeota archaeon]|nr:RNA methyltransferase [Candidatus Woesearchaeota archaeon]
MKSFFLVHKNFESLAKKEINELISQSSTIHPQVVACSLQSKEEYLTLLQHSQSSRRVLFALTAFKDITTLNLETINLPWPDIFSNELTFKVEVENLTGQDNRFSLSKQIASKMYLQLEKYQLAPKIDLKKPDILIIAFFNGEQFFLGLDFSVQEINSRAYRVFPHQASFKGDLAYYFTQYANIKHNHKILIGFVKDGSLAIESALYLNKLPITNLQKTILSKIPYFQNISPLNINSQNNQLIYAFDENMPNIIAAQKNASLANVKKLINFSKHSLDELDVKYEQHSFDNILFHITTKDEEKINELYYQVDYTLKSSGHLFLLTKKTVELSLSRKFELIQSGELNHGDSSYRLWLLQKK